MIDAPLWTIAPFVGLVFLAASSGALFPPDDWYWALQKPSWTPPNWVFPVVWTVLYLVIAYAAWRVWALAGLGPAIAAWGVQLLLNAGWSAVFFGLRSPRLALIELVFLWLAVALTIYLFAQVDPIAAALLLPYIAWVTLAGALNVSIVRLQGSARREP